MLIYEKDNKLNIKFDSDVEENALENPDFSLYKDQSDKVVISANGSTGEPGGGGGSDILTVIFTFNMETGEYACNVPCDDVKSAFLAGKPFNCIYVYGDFPLVPNGYWTASTLPIVSSYCQGSDFVVTFSNGTTSVEYLSDNDIHVT